MTFMFDYNTDNLTLFDQLVKRYSTVGGTGHDETEVGAHRCLPSYTLKPQGTHIFLRDAGQQQPASVIKTWGLLSQSTRLVRVEERRKCERHLLVSSRVGGSVSPRRSNSTALWTQGVTLHTLKHNRAGSLSKRKSQVDPPQVFILTETHTSVRKTRNVPKDSHTNLLQ